MAVYKILTENGVADTEPKAARDALDALADELKNPDAKILLHLHGGLVAEKSGIGIADRLSGPPPGGWGLGSDWTQVYVVWRTGAFESLRSDWESLVKNDRLYQAVLRRILVFAARKLSIPIVEGRGGAAASGVDDREVLQRITGKLAPDVPFTTFSGVLAANAPPGARATMIGGDVGALAIEFEDELIDDELFQSAADDIDAVVNAKARGRVALAPADAARGAASFERLDASVKAELQKNAPDGTPGARGLVSVAALLLKHGTKIAYRCFERFRTERDHGLHATIVEELCRELYGDLVGARAWGLMVKHAADHFGARGYGTTLVGQLAAQPPAKMVVTAHSAGAIWAAHLLQAMQAAGVTSQVELFLLAPAVRQSLFAEAVGKAGATIGRCRMLTMDDELERRDAVLGHDLAYIYPSSLLYLISGLFEERGNDAYPDAPILGMARFTSKGWLDAGEAKDAQAIAAFFQQPDKGILYAPEAGVTMAESHGAFDNEPLTLKTVGALF